MDGLSFKTTEVKTMTDERIEMARVLREVGVASLSCAKGLELIIKHMQEIDEKLDALAGGGFLRMKDDAGNPVLMPINSAPDHPDPGAALARGERLS